MMSIKLSNIAILNIKGADHLCKSEATMLKQNSHLTEKKKQNIIEHKKLISEK